MKHVLQYKESCVISEISNVTIISSKLILMMVYLGLTLNIQNVVILIKYVFNKNHNHCYYEMFFKKCSYK